MATDETSFERVRSYYEEFDEWGRLDTPAGRFELERTIEIANPYLEDGSCILDLGGGPGRYALELARRGHAVDLVDLSPQQIEFARAKISTEELAGTIRSARVGNAIALSDFASDQFDAVLALGPLYHLVHEEDRRAMAKEIVRVLRPGGTAFVAFIPRLSNTAWLMERAAATPERVPAAVLRSAHEQGILHNPTEAGFQEGFYTTAAEVISLFSESGMHLERVESIRGLAYGRETVFADMPEETLAVAQEIVKQTATDPAVVEMSGHALYVGKKGR